MDQVGFHGNKYLIYIFIFMLFLYPFNYFDHLLYLIPQAVLLFLAASKLYILKRKIPRLLVYLIFSSFVIILFPFLTEVTSANPDVKQYIKIPINIGTIIFIYASGMSVIGPKSERILYFSFMPYILLIFQSFIGKSISEVLLRIVLNLGNSSILYQSAEALQTYFLTKNITSMFFISLMGFYLFLKKYYSKKLKIYEILTLFLLIFPFFSRQAYLSFMVLLYLYFLFSKVRMFYKIFSIAIFLIGIITAITFMFNFSNSADGSSERLLLWSYFFSNIRIEYLIGIGVKSMNFELLSKIGIDNYHMFFMNQIVPYGIFFFFAFNFFLLIIFVYAFKLSKYTIFLLVPFFLNILFQTYGYEFQNLFLFIVMISVINLNRKVKIISGDLGGGY